MDWEQQKEAAEGRGEKKKVISDLEKIPVFSPFYKDRREVKKLRQKYELWFKHEI